MTVLLLLLLLLLLHQVCHCVRVDAAAARSVRLRALLCHTPLQVCACVCVLRCQGVAAAVSSQSPSLLTSRHTNLSGVPPSSESIDPCNHALTNTS
jgi:hypothetical protein